MSKAHALYARALGSVLRSAQLPKHQWVGHSSENRMLTIKYAGSK